MFTHAASFCTDARLIGCFGWWRDFIYAALTVRLLQRRAFSVNYTKSKIAKKLQFRCGTREQPCRGGTCRCLPGTPRVINHQTEQFYSLWRSPGSRIRLTFDTRLTEGSPSFFTVVLMSARGGNLFAVPHPPPSGRSRTQEGSKIPQNRPVWSRHLFLDLICNSSNRGRNLF